MSGPPAGGSDTRCRVCLSTPTVPFAHVDGRAYARCAVCGAVMLDASQFPDAEAEKAQYLLHENNPADAGYRAFLNRVASPLLERLAPASSGLDYGCGPGPTLDRMLAEAGHAVSLYDPFFYPDKSVLEKSYDFICCTEVAEHFHRPAEEFARLNAMLVPGGWLAVMTRFLPSDGRFADWHYRRDPTHVVFYRAETFQHLAHTYGWRCEIPAPDVVLLRKSPHSRNDGKPGQIPAREKHPQT